MRVLIITPTPTHPPHQGNRVRVSQIASMLKDCGCWVELLYYAVDGFDKHSVESMRAEWHVLYTVSTGYFVPRRANPAFWGVDDWISPNLIEATRSLAENTHYDLVVVNYVWMSLLLRLFPDETLKVLDTHDAFGGRHEVARKAGMQPHWFYTSKAEEGHGLDRADIVLAIQGEEARYFKTICNTNVLTIEYAARPHFLPNSPSDQLSIGYLGSGNPWNVRSVEDFDSLLATELPPLTPAPHFLLFGGITRHVKGLRVLQPVGMVDNVADAYSEVSIVVNPMVGGTGLKVKTVEALAFGRSVLSTKAGGIGLEAIHSDLLHDDLSALVRRLIELILQPMQLASLTQQMRIGYQDFYNSVEGKVEALVRDLVARRYKS